MTHAIDGIILEDEVRGWEVLAETEWSTSVSRALIDFNASGRDGTPWGLRAKLGAPIIPLVMETPAPALPTLKMLLRKAKMLTDSEAPGIHAMIEVSSITPVKLYSGRGGDDPDIYQVSALVRIPELWWVDDAVTTSPALSLNSADPVFAPVFPNLTGEVRDGMLRVLGSATGLRVEDPEGSFFTYAPNIPAGTYLRFESKTGRAFTTPSDVWIGGTDVTTNIRTGKPPYPFNITPSFTDPSTTSGRLKITTTARNSAASFQSKGYSRHER